MNLPWVSRKKYNETVTRLNSIIEGIALTDETRRQENMRLKSELDACWKCINSRSNKGHWEKQKRVKGRFAK